MDKEKSKGILLAFVTILVSALVLDFAKNAVSRAYSRQAGSSLLVLSRYKAVDLCRSSLNFFFANVNSQDGWILCYVRISG